MELLQLLLSFLFSGDGAKKLSPILELLKSNDFNLSTLLSNLKLETILPLIQSFFNSQNKNPTENYSVGNQLNFNAVSDIADAEIVETLNKYFSSTADSF